MFFIRNGCDVRISDLAWTRHGRRLSVPAIELRVVADFFLPEIQIIARMKMRILLLALFCGSAIFGQSDKQERIAKILAPFETNVLPGLSVMVSVDGKIAYSKGFGMASVEKTEAITPRTVFNVGSVAKQFTAACIWILIAQKKISVEDDVAEFLPELRNIGRQIRIKQLLDHSSGIRNYHTIMDLQGFDYETEYYNNQTVLALAANQKLTTDSKSKKTSYSNTNYNLLALTVERVSGQDLNAFASQHLFSPLGMNATAFRISNRQTFENRAFGYSKTASGFSPVPQSSQESYGAGNLWTSGEDLFKWMQVLNGNIVRYEPLRRFLTGDINEPSINGEYARGVMIARYNGCVTISHSGSEFGWKSYLVSVPEQKIGIVVLSNSDIQNPTAIANSILDILLETPSTSIPSVNKPKAVADFDSISGRYLEIDSDMQLLIYSENDTLKSRGLNAKAGVPLLSVDGRHFYRKANPGITYDFAQSGDWDMIISFSGNPFYFKKTDSDVPANVDTSVFEGEYFSDELQTSYRFHVTDSKLFLSFKNNPNVELTPIQIDEFGNGKRTRYSFKRDKENKVSGVIVASEGNVGNVLFQKR